MTRIERFQGKYWFLSNFWPVTILFQGILYPSVEHAYQAAKTDILEERLTIAKAPSASVAKRLGRRVTMRHDWESIKLDVMLDLLRRKFARPELKRMLQATAPDELVEGNRWRDTFWGVDLDLGWGENHLGKLLMKVRDGH